MGAHGACPVPEFLVIEFSCLVSCCSGVGRVTVDGGVCDFWGEGGVGLVGDGGGFLSEHSGCPFVDGAVCFVYGTAGGAVLVFPQ